MATQIFTNISLIAGTANAPGFIRGKDLAALPVIKNGYIIVEDNLIAAFGNASELSYVKESHRVEDGTIVLPCWCDSHSHIVFAGSREEEFVDKINGLSYAEIAAKGRWHFKFR